MTDKEFADKHIANMTERALLEFVFEHPEYLTDNYYSTLGKAMVARFYKLVGVE